MPKSTKSSNVEVDETVSPTDNGEITNHVNASDFNMDSFYLKPIEEKLGTKSQYMAFPKYKFNKKSKEGDNVLIVTEPIKLTKGGIPKIDGEYKKSDKDREFFWLGCDKEQPACVKLFEALEKIDQVYSELISDNANTKTIYQSKDGKKEPLDKLEYVSLVRESSQPENAKDGEKQYEAYNRIKVRFGTKYVPNAEEGEPSEITTHLFLLDKEEPEPYTSVTDFEKSLRWGCEARFVLCVNKFWAMKALKNKKRECGFTVKCLQVYITKESTVGGGTSQVEKFRKRLFATPAPSIKEATPAPVKETKAKATKVESEESEDESEDEKPKKTTTTKKPVKKDDTESDSDDSESDSDSDSDDSDSDDKKKKGSTKPVAKNTKKVASESEEESDSEDEKPKAKPAKGKAKASK